MADDNKATQDYLDLMEQYNPDGKVAQLGQQTLSSCLLFAPAATACGSELTARCLLEQAAAQDGLDRWRACTPPEARQRRRRARASSSSASTPTGFVYDEEVTRTDRRLYNCDPENIFDVSGDYSDARRRRAEPRRTWRLEEFLDLTVLGLCTAAIFALGGERARPHVHDDRHLQLRPRRDRHARRVRATGSCTRLGVAHPGRARRRAAGRWHPLLGLLIERRDHAGPHRRSRDGPDRRHRQPARRAARARAVGLAAEEAHRRRCCSAASCVDDLRRQRHLARASPRSSWPSAVAVGLRLLLYRTRAGLDMRAAVDSRPLALLHGARPDRSAALAWAIGCSLAALAGILIAPRRPAEPHLAHPRSS